MSIDSNGRAHAPKGTNTGGRFTAQAAQESTASLPVAERMLDWDDVMQMSDALALKHHDIPLEPDYVEAVKRVYLNDGARRRLLIIDEFPEIYAELQAEHPDLEGPGTYGPENAFNDNLGIANHKSTDTRTLDRIAEEETDPEFLAAVAQHPNASAYALGRVARSPLSSIRRLVIRNDNTDAGDIEELKETVIGELSDLLSVMADNAELGEDNEGNDWTSRDLHSIIVACEQRLRP